MADSEFKLPVSSFSELTKLLIAFAKSKNAASLDDLNKLTGINKTLISSNNGFLDSIGAISGGNKKEATPDGKKLGLALANFMEDEAKTQIKKLLSENEFIESMITALEIKPRSVDDFQSHIAYSLGKELKGRNKTGTGSLIEMMEFSDLIEENDGLLSPVRIVPLSPKLESLNKEDTQKEVEAKSTSDSTSITQKFTNELGQNVTLNINVQLTIPDTDDEKVYENFFKAMKKHLLS
ncbi:hypothetical protein [Roseivirga sp.]|uniref:hypothetical protein n=1 Tax=Roseivirga sp. TaxID=1964215 RepID=UPI003B8E0E3F